MPFLEWRGLVKRYAGHPALDGVTLSLERGGVLVVLGPSGCGKTTLLRLTAGLETPDAGIVLLDGADLGPLPPERRGIGLVFQDYVLFPHLDVAGNVGFGLRMARWPRSRMVDRVRSMLALVGLAGYERRRVQSLSGGEQQRVALARGLAPGPRVLMLDEPLGALDASLRTGLLDEVPRILHAAGATTVYVTHDQEEALAVADRVAVMRSGRIVQAGRPTDLVERPADAFVAGFLRLGTLVPVSGRTASEVVTPLGRLPVHVAGRPENSMILVRPEAVRLRSGPAFVPVRARVVSVQAGAYGGRLRLALEGAGGERYDVRCLLEPGRSPPAGRLLRVWLDPRRLRSLPTR
ncbi:MAG: ABC transporter ATP-binding protein [Spirochaetes bacterium]|nr:ABC transporter ATP-binding protein [Spirochaetota bacterium]